MIRNAVQADIVTMAEIYEQLHFKHCEIRKDYFNVPPKDFYIKDLKNTIDGGLMKVIVCEENGEIQGYAQFYIHEHDESETRTYYKWCIIEHLAVNEKFQRQGIGTKIIEYIKKYALDNACYTIALNVWYENYGAVDFYASVGFIPRTYSMEMKLRERS